LSIAKSLLSSLTAVSSNSGELSAKTPIAQPESEPEPEVEVGMQTDTRVLEGMQVPNARTDQGSKDQCTAAQTVGSQGQGTESARGVGARVLPDHYETNAKTEMGEERDMVEAHIAATINDQYHRKDKYEVPRRKKGGSGCCAGPFR